MKMRIEVDLTPKEFRELIGLPDVAGIQDDLIQYIRERMAQGVDIGEALQMLKGMVPEQIMPGRLQRFFARAAGKMSKSAEDGASSFKMNFTEEDLREFAEMASDDEDLAERKK